MRISLTSDWHFEHYDSVDFIEAVNLINGLQCDLNIVAGDVDSRRYMREYFEEVVDNCFMIRGNHDYYGDIISNNVKHLDKDGISVLGCTLWTSFNDDDPWVKNAFNRNMIDARYIEPKKTLIEEIKAINKQNFELIMDTQPDIVVTHHCPTLRSIHPIFSDDVFTNYCFSNDYEKHLQNTKIKYWVFGHTHWKHEYTIGNTKFLCNPRGYPREIKEKYTPVVFEI